MCRSPWLSLGLCAAALAFLCAVAPPAPLPGLELLFARLTATWPTDLRHSRPADTNLPGADLPAWQGPLPSLWLADLTWTEIARAQAAGYDTVLIPTGGMEPGGPHLVAGKHNHIVHHTAQQIAVRHRQMLVAPVLPYVPQPPPHRNYPGTISVPADVFQQVVEAAADGFLEQGFRQVVLLGDSGANQAPLQAAAQRLRHRWSHRPEPVVFLDQYYSGHGQTTWLEQQGFSPTQQGTHAALADTAELLAIAPQHVRQPPLPPADRHSTPPADYDGRPDWATPKLGDALIELKVQAALDQLLPKSSQTHTSRLSLDHQ